MASRIVLVPKVTLDMKYILIELEQQTKNPGDTWLEKEIVQSEKVAVKNIFGYKTLQTLAKEIAKIQNKMLARYKADRRYLNLVKSLCSQFSIGEFVIQDERANNLINGLKK